MELKNILSKLNTSQDEKKELFLAIEVASDIVKSAIWTIEQGKTTVLQVGTVEEWDENKNNLVSAVDRSINKAFENLASEPNKVIFGLPENWVVGSNISEDKKKILSSLCSKLEFKPIGFVVTLEALSTFLKEKEGIPISAIYIHLSEGQIIVSLVNTGKIIGSQKVGRSEDLAADVREGLARFGKIDNLPSRMILYNGVADFEEAKQQLISFDWQENLPFLHFPKVETLGVADPVKAVAIAGGAEAAKSLGFEILKDDISDDDIYNEGFKKDNIKKTDDVEMTDDVSAEPRKAQSYSKNMGFVQNKDIIEVKTLESVFDDDDKKTADKKVNKDIHTKDKKMKIIESGEKKKNLFEKLKSITLSFKKEGFKLPSLKNKTPIKKPASLIVILFLFLVIFTIGGWAFYWYAPKANVTIYLKPKILEKELGIIIDPAVQNANNEENIIPGRYIEVEVLASKTIETTGTKLVGDKASGDITIFNKTELEKNFSKGTRLIGPDSLAYILDEDITISSKSSELSNEGEKIIYGKTITKVTAESIGQEYNLSSGTNLSFSQYPSSLYSASVENGLSGGTSREIKAVAEEDKERLKGEVEAELKNKADEQIKNKITDQEDSLEKGLRSEIVSEEFNFDVDDEADNLTLEMNSKYKFLVYKKDDLKNLLIFRLSDSVPDNFVFSDHATDISTENIEFEDNRVNMGAIIKVKLIPQLNNEELINNLKGKYPEIANEYLLKNIPNFQSAEIKIKPKLPLKLHTLPRVKNNINIEVKIKDD
jgi:hypothetical protein